MNRLKRMWAIMLSLAMILSSVSFGNVNVYADEGEITLDGSEGAVLKEENTLGTEESILPSEEERTASEIIPEDPEEAVSELKEDKAEEDKDPAEEVKDTFDEVDIYNSDGEAADKGDVRDNKPPVIDADGAGYPTQSVTMGDFTYVVDSQFAFVFAWKPVEPKPLMSVTVPSVIKELDKYGYNSGLLDDNYEREVIGIAPGAFAETEEQTYRLQSVELADSVKIIDAGAFENCSALKSIKFPVNMTRTATDVYSAGQIGDGAFKGCTSLETVTLPQKLDIAGEGIFAGCTSLTSVEIPAGWSATKVQKGGKNITPAEGTVVKGPFSGCENLATITFGSGTQGIASFMLANVDSIESISVPATITTIGDKAFYECDNLATVNYAADSKLVDIGKWAFQKCGKLTAAILPKYTKTIGQEAFIDCTSLTKTVIPFSIDTIGDKAYFRCVELSSISFDVGDETNINGGTIGKYAFGDNTYNAKTGYKNPLAKIESVTIPDSFTIVGEGAFEGCIGLKVVIFENRFPSVNKGQTINKKAFYNCEQLENLTFSDHIELIGESAFENCVSLATLTLPNSVIELGKAAFKSCISLENLKLSEKLKTLGESAFAYCIKLRQVTIPMSIEKVYPNITNGRIDEKDAQKGVFYACDLLTDITFKRYNEDDKNRIPDRILLGCLWAQNIKMPEGETTEIGDFAFAFCTALKEIHIPDSVVTICGGAFGADTRLGQRKADGSANPIVIPAKVTSIGRSAFKYCTSIEQVILPAALESLGRGQGDGAFESCTSLTEFIIPDTVNEIGASTFANCEKLERVTLPAGTTKIDDSLFKGCLNLKEVKNVSKDYLESIGASSFEGCEKLTSFDGSGTVDFSEYKKLGSIGEKAFYGCDGITSVTLSAATASLGASVFDNCVNLASVTIGTGPRVIPANAFANDPGLKSVVIPRNVAKLAQGAFSKDTNLEEIHIPKDTVIEAGVFSYCDKLTIYAVENSPAWEYAVNNGIKHKAEYEYATAIKFNDNSDILLNINQKKEIPGVDVKPVNYSVDVEYTSGNEDVFTIETFTEKNKQTNENETKYRIVAKGVGTARLTATVMADASGRTVSDSVNVTVKKPVQSITMASGMKKDNTLNIPETMQLAVVVNPADASDTTYKWVSDNEEVCVVDSEGVVYSKSKGEAKVAAISNDDPTKMCVFNFTITNSPVKKADPDWPNTIAKPRFAGTTQTSITGKYGMKVELTCDTPGAQIYYTVDGTAPMADYEGHMDGATRCYGSPIVADADTFGGTAIKSGVLVINAISIREGLQYSPITKLVINLPKGAEWGDVGNSRGKTLFEDDPANVPKAIWYLFDGDNNVYLPSISAQVTQVSKKQTGKSITFNEEINVFYGTNKLVEGRDYTVNYSNNINPAPASGEGSSPTVIIKGMGEYYKGTSQFRFAITAEEPVASKVTVTCSNRKPEYTGKDITTSDVGVTIRDNSTGAVLKEGTDYKLVSQTGTMGTFTLKFELTADKSIAESDPITVEPYDVAKHIKAGDSKVVIEPAKTAYFNKAGARPALSVKFDGKDLKEGIDYKATCTKNRKITKAAKLRVKFMGCFSGTEIRYFEVVKKDVKDLKVYAEDIKYKEGGKASDFKVLPKIVDNGKTVSKRKDIEKFTKTDGCKYYYASGSNIGKEIGDKDQIAANQLIEVRVTVKSRAKGPYVGTKELSGYYRVYTADKDIKKTVVKPRPIYIDYDEGNEIIPINNTDFELTMRGSTTPLGTEDFEIISVTQNRFIGTATVQVRGRNGYGGTKTFKVKIRKRCM